MDRQNLNTTQSIRARMRSLKMKIRTLVKKLSGNWNHVFLLVQLVIIPFRLMRGNCSTKPTHSQCINHLIPVTALTQKRSTSRNCVCLSLISALANNQSITRQPMALTIKLCNRLTTRPNSVRKLQIKTWRPTLPITQVYLKNHSTQFFLVVSLASRLTMKILLRQRSLIWSQFTLVWVKTRLSLLLSVPRLLAQRLLKVRSKKIPHGPPWRAILAMEQMHAVNLPTTKLVTKMSLTAPLATQPNAYKTKTKSTVTRTPSTSKVTQKLQFPSLMKNTKTPWTIPKK